jgi:hypothetical protein
MSAYAFFLMAAEQDRAPEFSLEQFDTAREAECHALNLLKQSRFSYAEIWNGHSAVKIAPKAN